MLKRRASANISAFWVSVNSVINFYKVGALVGIFKPNSQYLTICIESKLYCINSKHILHIDKDHRIKCRLRVVQTFAQQMHDAGRPPLWKIEKSPILRNGSTYRYEIWQSSLETHMRVHTGKKPCVLQKFQQIDQLTVT